MGIEISEIIQQKQELLTSKTIYEQGILCIETTPAAVNPTALKLETKKRQKQLAKYGVGIKPGEFGMSPALGLKYLNQVHTSFVNSFAGTLNEFTCLKKLNCHQAMKELRFMIDPAGTSPSYSPHLLGDRTPVRTPAKLTADQSHIMTPTIGVQLFDKKPAEFEKDSTVITLNNKLIAPLLVDIPPKDPLPFNSLFETMPNNIPWRFTISLTSGHGNILKSIGNKKSLATFLFFSSSENELIKNAANNILEHAKGGETLISVNMSFCTWADSHEALVKRKAELSQAVQSWGNIITIEEKGDAIEAWLETIPGILKKNISNTFPMLLSEALLLTPLTRPSSPWAKGGMLYRTMDDKLFPYASGSSLQNTWVDLVFAPPGMGKSFWLAAANTSYLIAAGMQQIPLLLIIDIGFSSTAWVQYIQSTLPDDKKHLAQTYKIQSTEELRHKPI